MSNFLKATKHKGRMLVPQREQEITYMGMSHRTGIAPGSEAAGSFKQSQPETVIAIKKRNPITDIKECIAFCSPVQ